MIRTVVAGLDGSPESLSAADWAAREALCRRTSLRLVHAWEWQPYNYGTRDPLGSADPQRRWAERIPREALLSLRDRYPELTITAEQIGGRPAQALLSAAADAELIVLGSRGRSALRDLIVGSVALAVVAATTRPVVLVRAGQLAEDERRPQDGDQLTTRTEFRDVVLGLDLVRPCDAVIEFAFDAASRRGADLRVVHGWNQPPAYGYSPLVVDPVLGAELADNEDDALAETLRPWREKFPDVQVDAQSVDGAAAHHLREAASSACLVVVGRRTRTSAMGPRIGPVVHTVLHRCVAPVAVIPHF